MKFTEILENLKKGEKATREKWGEPDCTIDFIVYDQNKGNFLLFYKGNCYRFNFNDEDIVAEDWKIYKEPTKNWEPKEGEAYYLILTQGFIDYTIYDSDSRADNERLSFGNCFKTREEAEHMLQKIRIIIQLRKLSNISFNDNCKQEKFVIFYNTENQQIKITQHKFIREIPFNIYFKNKKDCQKAIETIGEENLKKYYFDVED